MSKASETVIRVISSREGKYLHVGDVERWLTYVAEEMEGDPDQRARVIRQIRDAMVKVANRFD